MRAALEVVAAAELTKEAQALGWDEGRLLREAEAAFGAKHASVLVKSAKVPFLGSLLRTGARTTAKATGLGVKAVTWPVRKTLGHAIEQQGKRFAADPTGEGMNILSASFKLSPLFAGAAQLRGAQ